MIGERVNPVEYDKVIEQAVKTELLAFAKVESDFVLPESDEDKAKIQNSLFVQARKNADIRNALTKVANIELASFWTKKVLRCSGLKEFLNLYASKQIAASILGEEGPMSLKFDPNSSVVRIVRDFPSKGSDGIKLLNKNMDDNKTIHYIYNGKIMVPFDISVSGNQINLFFIPMD